jgi:hypothetical protein
MNIGPSPVVIPTNGPKESASTKVVPSDRPHSVGMSSAQGAGSIRVPAALSSLPSLEPLPDASARPQSLLSQLSSLKSELKPTNATYPI